ncbi:MULTISPECIES: S8 family serine peptidase [unclassified Massilia]|uniref:S8 family serine peptidase n=1 Tax=unclassified Massilia TaxID=2609279 RepID=UPI0017834BB5|nr:MULTISPECIES: S8 family serine peptidase [unclassified Massilia]MBD8531247.1 S8 family serine peptidase [Massilia sp. CFBP 13647]MBD8676490.1 S8 family serine peptidase [Massilia sp. CFBP 13721]
MNLRPVSFAVLTLVAGMALNASAQEVRRSYIVQLADKPVASYTGGVAGLAATKPAAGQRLDVTAANVQAYIGYLEQKQNNVLSAVGQAQLTHKYNVVLNGFAALLTDAEVKALKADPAVAAIDADEARQLDTNYTPTFLGLDKAEGLWNQQPGGKDKAGDGVIIGIVDGGIWPENKAFADRVDGNGEPTFDSAATQAFGAVPATWKGICQTGEGFTADHCNNKLIGARYFNTGFKASARVQHWSDFVSPRDSVDGPSGHGGHGTHTASTAGGNNGVAVTVNGVAMGKASGIAPHARVAAYKVCWTFIDPTNPDGSGTRNSCYNSDSVAAIDQAVKDGVNVINFSISGSQTSVTDPVEMAFFGAADANVFVAASAGNSGPANAVAHLSPWVTTVAASTHNRLNGATATTGTNVKYVGASLNTTALPLTPAISARDAGLVPFASLNAADQLARRLCYTAADRTTYGGSAAAALDASLVAGKVVLCERGNSARTDKSRAVAEVRGAGMVLIDTANALIAEVHAVPAVHISLADGTALRNYVQANPGATVSISTWTPQVGSAPAPVMASFSSRGPNQGYNNILKPDLTAPGVDILAGVTPVKTQAERDAIANGSEVPGAAWAFYQGTSMSSPHVAGLGALLKQLHPTWSPAAIKSALMTTAATTINDNQPGAANGLLPWAQGAGHVVPNKATDPGLVYDVTTTDYIRFMCGANAMAAATCASTGSIPAYNLNLPSLTAGAVLGKLTMTRTVTNVSDKASTYNATATLPGFTVAVSPATLNLAPGAKGTFTVNLTRTTAAMDQYAFGALEWRDGTHVVRSPLTARPTAFSSAASLRSEEVSGNSVFTVGTGFTGKLGANKGGLKPATLNEQTVRQTLAADGGALECKNGGSAGVTATSFTVPANTMVARFSLRDIDTSGFKAGQPDDLDLFVFNAAGTQVGYSGTATSNEMVTLMAPAAGTYRVCVAGYNPTGGSSTYTLASWVVAKDETGGNLKVNLPASVFVGGTASAVASWSGLTAGQRYLGAVQYLNGTTPLSTTLLEVDATNPVPTAGATAKLAAGGAHTAELLN